MSGIFNKYEARSAAAYDAKANDYENSLEGQFTLKFNTLLTQTVKLQDGVSVLDIACGNGRLLKMLAGRYAIKGYGTDISKKMISEAKRLNPGMAFAAARCEEIPFTGGEFDVITVSAAYHHFPDVKGFAREAYRLLKKQGKIYIAEIYYTLALRAIFNPFIRFSKDGDVKFYSPGEIIAALSVAGFKNGTHIIDGNIQIVMADRI